MQLIFMHENILQRNLSKSKNCCFLYARLKKQAELETYLKRMVNRYKKDLLTDTHKVKKNTFFHKSRQLGFAQLLTSDCSLRFTSCAS